MTTKAMIGSCTGHEEPDLWFLDLPRGRPSKRQKRKLLDKVEYIRAICDTCPVKIECLTIGMEPQDMAHGMRGGLLPGERIEVAIELKIDYKSTPCLVKGDPRSEGGFVRADEEESAMLFLEKVREWSANI